MTGSGGSSGRGSGQEGLAGVDRLLGRDLRAGGWFVREGVGRAEARRGRPGKPEDDGPRERKPDPAVIWALRMRKK